MEKNKESGTKTPRRKNISIIKTFLTVLTMFVFLATAVCLGGLWVLYNYGQDLPDYKQLVDYEPPVVSRLYAGDGRLFAEYAVEKRVFVPIKAIPRRIIRTFLAAEDKNFYEHPGIDALGILRAAFNNVINIGKAPMGASTITQQVAKNFFLSNERSLNRKIKEAILAFRIENTLSKDRILELYLNQIYLGQGSYGVAAAALNYFNKAMDELTVDEAAYLAALPKGPNNYHPDKAPKAAKRRRDYVLNRMVELGVISDEEGQEAKQRPIVLRPRHEAHVVQADFFAEEVRRELVGRYGPDSLYQGGLVVRTTLHPPYQLAAEQALREGLLEYDHRHGWRGAFAHIEKQSSQEEWLAALKKTEGAKGALASWEKAVVTEVTPEHAEVLTLEKAKGNIPLKSLAWARKTREEQRVGPAIKQVNEVLQVGDVVYVEKQAKGLYDLRQVPDVGGAILVLDPHTGRVLAMSGGFSFQISQFNRATQAYRQPGSSFKPFVFLAAFEAGRAPNDIVLDAPLSIEPGPGQPIWRPKNISKKFYGPVTLRTAVEKSYNISTIRVAQDLGMEKVCDMAKRLGVVDELPPHLSMVLGAGETTAKRMATAYAALVNGGKKVSLNFIDRIQDRHGKTIYRQDQRPCISCSNQTWEQSDMPILPDERPQIVHPIHAYQIVSILEGATKRGTSRKLAAFKNPLAGKTGTTNDYRSAWYIGMTPDLVIVIYVGFDDHRSLGDNEVGGKTPLFIFSQFAQEILKNQPPIPFRIPSGVRFMRVSHKTGQLTSARDPDAIWEAFFPGTEPKSPIGEPAQGRANVPQRVATPGADHIY